MVVPLDFTLSPLTGWTRDHWVDLAETLVSTAQHFGSENHARIHFPGAVGGYGHDVDGTEGFARTLLAAGMLAAGDPTKTTPLQWYAEGFRTGPDPTLDISRRWVRPSEHDQAKVEACSLALILHLTRPYLWDTFDDSTQNKIIDYFAEWIHAPYPKNNWVWFRLIVQQFMRSVGGPWSKDDLEEDLAFNESCYLDHGWYRDGEGRTFDYYCGWVFQVYPLLWCDMLPDDPETQLLRPLFQSRLDAYLTDAADLIGPDGSMMAQGRSLIYRFAQASALWMGAYTGSDSLTPGQVRRATSGMVKHFAEHNVPDKDGILTMGWYGPWRKLAQSYSGPGSPYWACKGLLGLALPATHPVWTATEEPLPIDGGDFVKAIPVPGWLLSNSQGIVRLTNHGTDHAHLGDDRADSPLYARLGYSTATFPLLDAKAWNTPVDQSVCLIDAQGRASHRTGFTPLGTWVENGIPSPAEPRDPSTSAESTTPSLSPRVGIAASRAQAHWVNPAPTQFLHGSGYVGDSALAGDITVISLVRGPWEVRCVRLESTASGLDSTSHNPNAQVHLRIGGWPVTDQEITSTTSGIDPRGVARAETATLHSAVYALSGLAEPGVEFREEASPLGTPSAVPYLDFLTNPGEWTTVLISLTTVSPQDNPGENARIAADIASTETHLVIHVVWPDAQVSEHIVRLEQETGTTSTDPTTHPVPHKEPSLKGERQ